MRNLCPPKEAAVDLPFREMREHRNLTQRDLADLAGVPLEIVQDIEAGVEEVSVEDVERTYQALQTRLKWARMRHKRSA